jgi:hypothetical protein
MVGRLKYFLQYQLEELDHKYNKFYKSGLDSVQFFVRIEMKEKKEDPRFIGLFNVLEILSGQRPKLRRLLLFYQGTNKLAIGEWEVILRDRILYNFIEYLVEIWLPIYIRREYQYKLFVWNNFCFFFLSEIGGLYGIPPVIFTLNKNNRLFLTFKIANSNSIDLINLLNGVYLEIKSEK